jgi:hypothetical protein
MSNCDCIYIDTDYNSCPECFHSSMPKARKQHKCCECNRTIEPGERYSNESGKWEGEFRIYKTCPDCLSIRDKMFCNDYVYTELWDNVFCYLQSIDYEISEGCLISLTQRARDMICDIIDEAQKEQDEDF